MEEANVLPVVIEEDDDDDDLLFASVDLDSKKDTERKRSISLIELLMEVWITSFSACKNLRLIIAFISNYLTNQSKKRKKTFDDVNRERESVALKPALLDFLGYVGENGSSLACSKDDLRSMIVAYRSYKLEVDGIDPFVRILFLTETYNEWIVEYKKYIQTLYTERAAAAASMATTAARCTQTEGEEDGIAGGSISSSNELFDISILEKRKDHEDHFMKQYIARLKDSGVLNTWRTQVNNKRKKNINRLCVFTSMFVLQRRKAYRR